MQQVFFLPMVRLLTPLDATQDNVQLLLLLLVITLAVALISRPLRLPYTLVLVVVGLIIGFSPLLPNLRLNPNLVLFLFLPALLFEGAWSIDVKQLGANWLMIRHHAVFCVKRNNQETSRGRRQVPHLKRHERNRKGGGDQ